MLDKSLPYFHVLMRRSAGTPCPRPRLPEGFTFSLYSEGDDLEWAEIESSVGEFSSDRKAALRFFREQFAACPGEVERRVIFALDQEGARAGTSSVWWTYKSERRYPSLGWIGVKRKYQGRSIGKALVFYGMEKLIEIEGDQDVYLHTQTWSYKAIGVYLQAGFEIMKEDTFAGFPNEYDKALPILKKKMGARLK